MQGLRAGGRASTASEEKQAGLLFGLQKYLAVWFQVLSIERVSYRGEEGGGYSVQK